MQVYGCNHVVIEVNDVKKAIAFYKDVFDLKQLDSGEGDAFFQLGAHQFLAIFEVKKLQPDRMRCFGLIVRDEQQIAEVRKKITGKYGLNSSRRFAVIFATRGATEFRSICTTNRLSGFCPMAKCSKPDSRFPKSKRPSTVTSELPTPSIQSIR